MVALTAGDLTAFITYCYYGMLLTPETVASFIIDNWSLEKVPVQAMENGIFLFFGGIATRVPSDTNPQDSFIRASMPNCNTAVAAAC